MAKEFTMGARLTLKDMFTSPMKSVVRATNNFKKGISDADTKAGRYYDSMGRLREANGRFAKSTQNSTRELKSQSKAAGSLKDKLFSLQGVVATVMGGVAVKGAFDWLVGANADMENYQNTLTVVMGSQEKAVKQLEWAEKFAAKTPFEIPQIVEATTRMESYGIKSKDTLGIVGDMASVMGKDLMQAVEAVADAQTGELERLKEFGITKKMIEEQAKAMGKSPVNNKGQITDTKAFNNALFTLMEKRFKGGMDMQSKSFKGMVSNVQDFMGTLGRQLGKPIFEAAKNRLQNFLGFLNRLKDSGTIDNFVANVQAGGRMIGTVFGAIGDYVVPILTMIRDKAVKFYNDNLPKLQQIKQAFIDSFTALWNYAQPVLSWLKDVALPTAVSWLMKLGSWVLNVATWFIDNWSWIKPLVTGIVIAFGTYFAIIKAITIATKIWTIAQAAYNAVMMMNPIGLIILGIGLLIGAGILLMKHWDKVKAFFKKWGVTILLAVTGPIGMIVAAIVKNWDKIKAFFKNVIPKAKEWGENIIKTLAKGITKMKDHLVDKVKGVFKSVRKLMPFSDAKEGPFSNLTQNGGKIVSTMAEGVRKQQGTLHKAMNGALEGTPGVNIKADKINAAGKTGTGNVSKRTQIKNLVEKLIIHGADGKNAVQLADEIIEKLYEKLQGADEILSGGDMGALLDD
jgi:hypothetical protein